MTAPMEVLSMKLLLIGSTGLVGRNVLNLALADPRIDSIVALARRPLPAHPKLEAPSTDFDNLPEDAPWWMADAVICTLGTTMRAAGSQEAFRRVDHTYPLKVARLARAHGTPCYVLNSAIGADTSSRFFYNRVKGEAEESLRNTGFHSLTIARPGLIGGKREEFRPAEKMMTFVIKALGPLLPLQWQINPAENIAQVLLNAAIHPNPGVTIIPSGLLT